MITVKKDRSVYISECDRHIGFENDNLVTQRIFEICDQDLFGFSFKLDLKNTMDIVDLAPCGETESSRLYKWNITSAAIGEGGVITAQIRAFNEMGDKVWHSAWIEFVSEPSVNAEKQINDERILSEYEQLEIRTSSAVTLAESSAASADESAKNAAADAKNAAEAAASAGAYYSLAETYRNLAEADAVSASQASGRASGFSDEAKGYAEKAKKSSEAAQTAAQTAKNTAEGLEELTNGYEGIVNTFNEHCRNADNPHSVTASQVGSYTKKEVDELLSHKRDTDDFTPIASAGSKNVVLSADNVSVETIDGDGGWAISENKLSATTSPFFAEGVTFTVRETGNIKFSVLAESFSGYTLSEEDAYIKVDGVKLARKAVAGYGDAKFEVEFDGMVEESIELFGIHVSFTFKEFTKVENTDGFMSSTQASRLNEVYAQVGNVSSALDAILAMENKLIGGETI